MTDEVYELLPPMVAADVDLRTFEFMPMHVTRLLRSDTWALCQAKPELAFYIVTLWLASWHEVPAGSLPNDDKTLRTLARCSPKRWPHIKDEVLKDWVICRSTPDPTSRLTPDQSGDITESSPR